MSFQVKSNPFEKKMQEKNPFETGENAAPKKGKDKIDFYFSLSFHFFIDLWTQVAYKVSKKRKGAF